MNKLENERYIALMVHRSPLSSTVRVQLWDKYESSLNVKEFDDYEAFEGFMRLPQRKTIKATTIPGRAAYIKHGSDAFYVSHVFERFDASEPSRFIVYKENYTTEPKIIGTVKSACFRYQTNQTAVDEARMADYVAALLTVLANPEEV